MVENTPNPLQKYFRQPAIYIKLPSGGQGYAPGTINMPANGEIPIYPMTAMDEILAKTPDALYNGAATVDIFKSCVPNIVDPWNILQSDIDALLMAIRIATYGHDLEMGSKCPKCDEPNDFTVDIRVLMDQLITPDYMVPCTVKDLTVYFKAQTYKDLNENAIQQFQEQKALQVHDQQENISESERALVLQKTLQSLTRLTLSSMSQSIAKIDTSGQSVTDIKYITEFLTNIDKDMFETVRKHLAGLREQAQLKPMKMKCSSCKHEYEQPFVLDQVNFFVSAS